MTYSYFGLLFGKGKVTLALLTALVTTGHAAVWSGVSNPTATRWVQAGIAQEGGQRFAYIEQRTPQHYSLAPYPAPASAVVHILSRGGRWRVTIDGHTSPWTWVPHGLRIACLEIFGDAHATAILDGAKIKSR